MNKVLLAWNICQDPEVKETPNGTKVATTSIATNEYYKDSNGEKQQVTEFHSLVAWGKTADLFENFIKKGTKLLIEWKIKTRSWEDPETGAKRYKTEITVEKVEFMGDKKRDGERTEEEILPEFDQPATPPKKSSRKPEEINIDDIPF